MRRTSFEDEHDLFRESVARFVAEEIVPHHEQWEHTGCVPRELFARAGEMGLIGMQVPEEYGGAGLVDFRFNQIINEEVGQANVAGSGLGITTHNDIALPYFLEFCDDEQKRRWLPGLADGTLIGAIALTEPGAGSDLAGITTSARREGEDYIVNGSKTFITNGINADLIVVAVRTDPSERHRGLSLVIVERDMVGFERGRNLDKLGMHAQDTAELFFNDVRVPVANRLGAEGDGFTIMTTNLAQERLSIALAGTGCARGAFALTLDYVKERKAFGQPIAGFQNTRFVLAEIATELELATQYLDQAVLAHNRGELSAQDAAMAKWWSTELQGRVVDKCLQLHGGYGYCMEYGISRAYADSRISRIYGGTTEIMKEIVGRALV